jgi:protein SCO1
VVDGRTETYWCRTAWVVLIVLFGLLACGTRPSPFALADITGLMPDLKFSLVNQNGRAVTAEDYRGEVLLLYFGYTQCPDACPMTLATLAQVVRGLGPLASKVRVGFVTVDPARDTTPVLKRYVSYFGPQFDGLRGDVDALSALTRRYRVAFHREKPDRDGNYSVDHSSAVFVFDAHGRPRLLIREEDSAKTIATDVRRVIILSDRRS